MVFGLFPAKYPGLLMCQIPRTDSKKHGDPLQKKRAAHHQGGREPVATDCSRESKKADPDTGPEAEIARATVGFEIRLLDPSEGVFIPQMLQQMLPAFMSDKI